MQNGTIFQCFCVRCDYTKSLCTKHRKYFANYLVSSWFSDNLAPISCQSSGQHWTPSRLDQFGLEDFQFQQCTVINSKLYITVLCICSDQDVKYKSIGSVSRSGRIISQEQCNSTQTSTYKVRLCSFHQTMVGYVWCSLTIKLSDYKKSIACLKKTFLFLFYKQN